MALKDDLRRRSAADLREERDTLGWVRQPAVRWLEPGLLVKAGVEVVVSGAFGKFADKRESQQIQPQREFDYSRTGDLWIDYLSDTGDGWEATYTMAYALAQPELAVDGEALPRGAVLLLGGDQVYPSAEVEAYEDRFIGPFRAALPRSTEQRAPDLYATPGNHDWYDGLTSFMRVFCAERWIGGWQTRQQRSYYALKLAHNWWIWAIDIQLDTYLDEPQLDYFRALEIEREPGAKVVLLTAKPSWTKAHDGRVEPESWRYLSFFEERMIRDRGARLVATITGDTHHYARFDAHGEGADEAPTRITAGGGGAYLSPTHTLRRTIDLRPLGRETATGAFEQRPVVTYAREQVFPRVDASRKLARNILKLTSLSPGFSVLVGAFYALLAASMIGSLSAGESKLGEATEAGLVQFLGSSFGGLAIVLAIVLYLAIFGGTDLKPWHGEKRGGLIAALRWVVAALHTLAHVALVTGCVWLAIEIGDDSPLLVLVLALAIAYLAGALLGTTLWALSLLLVHRARGHKAPQAANQVFSAQAIPDYKSFLRMRLARDGGLTIYALGVERVGREWDHVGGDGTGPHFVPRVSEPVVTLVDGPLEFDRSGDRA